MSGLSHIIRNIKQQDLIITPRLDEWLIRNADEGFILNDEEILLLARLLSSPRGSRVGSFTGSQAGDCERRQVFNYIGLPKLRRVDPVLQNKFMDGNWRHARHQLMLRRVIPGTLVEVRVDAPSTRFRGALDAVNFDERWGYELKGWSNFFKVVEKAPFDYHQWQAGRYWLATDEDPTFPVELDKWIFFYEDKRCVPSYSRCLTRQGWTYHKELKPEDEILTWNPSKDRLEWEPYQGKFVYEEDDEPLLEVGNKYMSFLSTANHKWPVITQTGEDQVRTTDVLNSNTWLRRTAPYQFPKTSPLTPDEAELIGWIASDGCIHPLELIIYQSKTAGVDALRKLLKGKERVIRGPYRDGLMHFCITGDLRRRLRAVLPHKDQLPSLVTQLDKPAMEAFVRGMMGGDGSWASKGLQLSFAQNPGPVKEAFQVASTLLGTPVNITPAMSCYPSNRQFIRAYRAVETNVTDEVWCPKTSNGFWLMEQNGKVVITGNSQEWREIVVERTAALERAVKRELRRLNEHVEEKTLPLVEGVCRHGTGSLFRECPFSKDCLRVNSWDEAEAVAQNGRPSKRKKLKHHS